jgi:hypothetical protein
MVKYPNLRNDLKYSVSDKNSFVNNNNNGFDDTSSSILNFGFDDVSSSSIEENMYPRKKLNQSMKRKNNRQRFSKLTVKNKKYKTNRNTFINLFFLIKIFSVPRFFYYKDILYPTKHKFMFLNKSFFNYLSQATIFYV